MAAFEKAALVAKTSKERLEFTYNPSEISISKTASWTPTKAKGVDVPMLEYGGSASRSLTAALLFDDVASPLNVGRKLWKLGKGTSLHGAELA